MLFREKKVGEDHSSLWTLFCEGDDKAYGLLYKKYAGHLYRLGSQFTTDKTLIEDSIHDVFVKIHSNRTKLHDVENEKIYLFVSFKNTLFNAFKKNKIVLDLSDSEDTDWTPKEEATAETLLIDNEADLKQQVFITQILSQLSVRQREAIHYRYFESMPVEQIAELMGMNYQSVSNLIYRALSKIKKDFEKK